MTEKLGSAQLELSTKDKGLRRGIAGAKRDAKSLDRQFTQSSKIVKTQFAQMSTLLLRFAGPLGIGLLFRSVIRQTAEFGQSLSDLSAITGAVGKDLDFFKDQAREVGRTTTKGAAEFLEAVKLIASAKPELLKMKEALADITKEAVVLAEASGLTLPRAADALVGALNQFNEGAKSAARFINIMAAEAQKGSAEIPDLTRVLSKAGTGAKDAGLSFEQFAGTVGVLAKFKQPIDILASSLKNIFIILTTRVDDAGKAIDRTNPKIVGWSKSLENLAQEHLTDIELVKLFGRETLQTAQQLLQIRGEIDSLTIAITGTNQAYDQAITRTANLNGGLARLKNAWADLNLSVGEGNGFLDQTVGLLAATLRGITDIIEVTKSQPGGFNLFGGRRFGTRSMVAGVGTTPQSLGVGRVPTPEIPLTNRQRMEQLSDAGSLGLRITPNQRPEDFVVELFDLTQVAKQELKRLEIAALRSSGKIAAAVRADADLQIAAWQQMVEDKIISEEDFARARVAINTNAQAEINASLKESEKSARSVGIALETAFQNALFTAQSFGDALEALGKKLLSLALFGKGGGGGIFGKIFGTVFPSLFGGGRKHGGRVNAGQGFVVGEKRPEFFLPDSPGRILPSINGAGGQRLTVLQNNTFPTDVQNSIRAEVLNIIPLAAELGMTRALDELRRQGVIS